jgi:lipocalin
MIVEGVLLMTIASGPLPTQDWADLARYAGRWYEIARLPNRFQDQCEGDVAATYTLRPDGHAAVHALRRILARKAHWGSRETTRGTRLERVPSMQIRLVARMLESRRRRARCQS